MGLLSGIRNGKQKIRVGIEKLGEKKRKIKRVYRTKYKPKIEKAGLERTYRGAQRTYRVGKKAYRGYKKAKSFAAYGFSGRRATRW